MPLQNQPTDQVTPFDDLAKKPIVTPKVIDVPARGAGAKTILRIKQDFTPLLSAVFKFDLQQAACILKKNPEFVNVPEPNHYYTPLLLACEIKNDELALEFVKLLVSCGANTSQMNSKSKTPLYQACSWGNLAVAKFLIEECGENVNQPLSHHRPLVATIEQGRKSTFDYLISKGADIHMTYTTATGSGFKPIHNACQFGRLNMVEKLIELGADVHDCSNTTQLTPFYCACIGGNLEVIKILLSKDVKVNVPKKGGILPIHAAAQCTNASVVQYLLSNGLEYVPDSKGNYPIVYAKKGNKTDIIAYFSTKYPQETEAGCNIM